MDRKEYLDQFNYIREKYKNRESNPYYQECQDVAYRLWKLIVSDEPIESTNWQYQQNYNMTYILENMRKEDVRTIVERILRRIPICEVLEILSYYKKYEKDNQIEEIQVVEEDSKINYDEVLDEWYDKIIDKADILNEKAESSKLGSKEYFKYKSYADGLIMATSMLSREEKRSKYRK